MSPSELGNLWAGIETLTHSIRIVIITRRHASLREDHWGSFNGKGHSNILVTTPGFHNKSGKIWVDTNTKYRIFRSNSRFDSNDSVALDFQSRGPVFLFSIQGSWVTPSSTQPFILPRSIKWVPEISGNLVVKSKLPPQSGSSLEAFEPLRGQKKNLPREIRKNIPVVLEVYKLPQVSVLELGKLKRVHGITKFEWHTDDMQVLTSDIRMTY